MMLYEPFCGSFARPGAVGNSKAMHPDIPNLTGLPSPLLSQMQERIPLSCISLTPTFIGAKGGNLSDYSSLSSSLVSLHSNSAAGSSSSSSGTQYSLWLKLRVCPSYLLLPSSKEEEKKSVAQQSNNGAEHADGQSAVSPPDSTLDDVNSQSGAVCPLANGSCPFAHPSANVRVENGHVTVCYDFIKRKKCKYESCKYYHPPHYQIDEILRRGNEQRRLNGIQPRSSDFMPQSQSASPIPNGGVASTSPTTAAAYHQHPSGTGMHWQPAAAHSMYSAYLTGGATPVPLPFSPASGDPTSMLLAAALQQQQQQRAAAVAMMAPPSSTVGLSGAPVSANGGSVNSSSASSTSSSVATTSALSVANGIYSIPVVSDSWLYSKRSSHAGGDSVPDCAQTDNASYCNGGSNTGSYSAVCGVEQQPRVSESDFLSTFGDQHPASMAPAFSSAYAYPSGGGYCASSMPPQLAAAAAVSNLLNPLSLYSLPYSTQPGIGGSPAAGAAAYMPTAAAAQYSCTPVYSAQQQAGGTADNQATIAALALNNLLAQQQQQQQQQQQSSPTISCGSLQQPTQQQLAGTPVFSTNPHQMANLAATLAALQQQQHSSTELHHPSTSMPSAVSSFHQNQQQQQAFLATLLRAQQSQLQQQLMAAQFAAAMQQQAAGGQAAYVAQHPGACLVDSPFSTGLNGLAALAASTSPYSMAGCYPGTVHHQQQQNPITNVVYINEKGNLLETLPICRDFKAGKCHRNTECRYVHLLDENVEVHHGRVTVCRDAAKGRCSRGPCKYFHVPLFAISTHRSLALNSVLTSNNSNAAVGGGAAVTSPVTDPATPSL